MFSAASTGGAQLESFHRGRHAVCRRADRASVGKRVAHRGCRRGGARCLRGRGHGLQDRDSGRGRRVVGSRGLRRGRAAFRYGGAASRHAQADGNCIGRRCTDDRRGRGRLRPLRERGRRSRGTTHALEACGRDVGRATRPAPCWARVSARFRRPTSGTGPRRERPALFSFRRDKAQRYVRIAPGTGTFLDQVVDAPAQTTFTMRARIRSAAPGAEVSFALCAKWILYSTDCSVVTLRTSRANHWEQQVAVLAPPGRAADGRCVPPDDQVLREWRIREGAGRRHRPRAGRRRRTQSPRQRNVRGRRLPLVPHRRRSTGRGTSPTCSSKFSSNKAGWACSPSRRLIAYALALLLANGCRGDAMAAASAAALLGFLVPAGFDSVIDDPRMRLLLWLLVTVPLLLPPRDGTTRGGR